MSNCTMGVMGMKLKDDVLEMKKEVQEVKNQSFAMEILKDYKRQNKRQFIVILVILAMWFATIGYLVYVLNDIGVVETTTEVKQSDAENNNYIGNNGDIINGKSNN